MAYNYNYISNIFNWIKKTSLHSIITKTTYQEHFLILERKCFVSPVFIPSSTQILLLLQDREPRSLSLKTTDFSSRPAWPDMIFVQLFTHPDFQAKNFTPVNGVNWDIVHSPLSSVNTYLSCMKICNAYYDYKRRLIIACKVWAS